MSRHGDRNERLLAGARAGEGAAWRSLVEDLGTALLVYLRAHRVTEPDLLLDEVFLELAHGLRRFDCDATTFWERAFTIARRRALGESGEVTPRSADPSASTPRTGASEADAAAAIVGTIGSDDVLGLLDDLDPEAREVILLRVLGDLSLEQTARVTGRPVRAVRDSQDGALRALRGQLGPNEAHPERSVDRGLALEMVIGT